MTETPPRRPPQASPRSRKKPAAPPPAVTQEPADTVPDHLPGTSRASAADASAMDAPAVDGAPIDAAAKDAGAQETAEPRKRIHKPRTEEQRLRRNARCRRRTAEMRDQRLSTPCYTLRQSKLIEAYLRL